MAGMTWTQAEAALRAGAAPRAAELLDASVRAGEDVPEFLFARLSAGFIQASAPGPAETWARRGLEAFPRSADLWELVGVALRRARQLAGALEALEQARTFAPDKVSILVNIANVQNDRGDGAAAEAVLRQLIALTPTDPQVRHMLGRARRHQGDLDGADAALVEALDCDPHYLPAWTDRAMLASERQDHERALVILDEGLRLMPGEARLIERRAEMLIRAGRADEARAALAAVVASKPDAAWAHHQLARLLIDTDLDAALTHAERASDLEPRNLAYGVVRAHANFRAAMAGRPDLFDKAAAIADAVLAFGPPPVEHAFVVRSVFSQTAAVDKVEAVGDFAALGRYWAQNGWHASLFSQLPLANSPERRRELLNQHRLWAGVVERYASRNVLEPRPRLSRRERLRVGFLSSDLRNHAVGKFALTLFDHYDPDRFELYAYSFRPNPPDAVQQRIAGRTAGYRVMAGFSERAAAQAIADDGLDLLIELGATTRWNYAQVMAWRPAPLQASWLGYPHSVGLSDIDHLVLDAHLAPTDPDLVVEAPLLMPHSWLAMSEAAFTDEPGVDPALPETRTGALTFGTANSPSKYTRAGLEAWARVLAAVPGSRFLFLRPEGASQAFRRNVAAVFQGAGVDPARLDFEPVVGGHLPHYNRMDISLDTFPLTGGTTTCESLWMGTPVVSLRGEAVYQRLSHSILVNAGLEDLSTETVEAFVAKAVELAADAPRRAELRRTIRQRLLASPLGRPADFARDFFALMETTIEGSRRG